MPEMPEKRSLDEAHNVALSHKRRAARECRLSYSHRLHYRWSQLEADRCSLCPGSPAHPLPTPSRTLEITSCTYKKWSKIEYDREAEKARLVASMNDYYSADYNTFCKNGVLKLTEIELYFLSSVITRKDAHEWVVIYLGIGNGDRFRWLRDEFFPSLSVIGFDPLDKQFFGSTEEIEKTVKQWNEDGTGFTFVIACADADKDPPWILEKTQGKKLLLISDIRGVARVNETHFDKDQDQELQWRFIQKIRPIKSLVKFTSPSYAQVFEYPPGVILKQVFSYYSSLEVRLMIDGTPETTRKYNAWDLYKKMTFHHEHVRGQVYDTFRNTGHAACLDNCFDCSILWETVSKYAMQNGLDADDVLRRILKYQIYTPADDTWRTELWWLDPVVKKYMKEDSRSAIWCDALSAVQRGNITQAIAALEASGSDEDAFDLEGFVKCIRRWQPDLAIRLKQEFQEPASQVTRTKGALIKILGTLSKPFTLLRTELNGLLSDESDCDSSDGDLGLELS